MLVDIMFFWDVQYVGHESWKCKERNIIYDELRVEFCQPVTLYERVHVVSCWAAKMPVLV